MQGPVVSGFSVGPGLFIWPIPNPSRQEVGEAAEREYILKKLDEAKGNLTRTAELLGLERSNLYRKMKTLGIGPKE